MFLNRLGRGLVRSRDDGAAMIAVIGVMALGMVLTALIASTLTSGFGFTTAARAGIQSQAAAEAGLAVARAQIEAGNCTATGGVFVNATGEPEYRAEVWRQTAGGGWEQGCPLTEAMPIRIISGGEAANGGLNGNTGQDQTFVEALFEKQTTPTEIVETGPAVFAYSSTGFGGGGNLVSVDGSEPDVLVKTGDVYCDGNAQGIHHLVVQEGSLTMTGSCNIAGNVWATGSVTLMGGIEVGGNVVGDGVIMPNGEVFGSVWSTDKIEMDGGSRVWGNLTGQSVDLQGGTVDGNVWSYGSSTHDWGSRVKGDVTARSITVPAWSNLIDGAKNVIPNGPGPSPYPTPESPIVPDWYDFTYQITDWTGFGEVVLSGYCGYQAMKSAVDSLAGAPGVIDARQCTNAISISQSDKEKLQLKNDLAIIANRFDFGGGGGFTTTGDYRLWLITPDVVADKQPTCASGSYFWIGGGFTFASNLSVMIYTPCRVYLGSSTTFNGQVFTGEAEIAGGAHIGYVQVGLPGVNLNTGEAVESSSEDEPWRVVSVRNRPDDGR